MFIIAELGSLTHHSYPDFSNFHSFNNIEKTLSFKCSQRLTYFYCDLGEARTLDPLIKSQLLYQLSYEVILFSRLMLVIFSLC